MALWYEAIYVGMNWIMMYAEDKEHAGANHFPPDSHVTCTSNSMTACRNVSVPHSCRLWAARGRLALAISGSQAAA
jgi:hypothetical protein